MCVRCIKRSPEDMRGCARDLEGELWRWLLEGFEFGKVGKSEYSVYGIGNICSYNVLL